MKHFYLILIILIIAGIGIAYNNFYASEISLSPIGSVCDASTFCFVEYKGESWSATQSGHATEAEAISAAEANCAKDKKVKLEELKACIDEAKRLCLLKSTSTEKCEPKTRDLIVEERDCKVTSCTYLPPSGTENDIKCYSYTYNPQGQRTRQEVPCAGRHNTFLDYRSGSGWRCKTDTGKDKKIVTCKGVAEESPSSIPNPDAGSNG